MSFGMAHYTSGRSGFQTTTTTTFPAPSPVAAFMLHQTTGRNGFDESNKKDSSATSSTESAIAEAPSAKTSKDRLVRAGIRCDHCMQDPIVGIRYRCRTCTDFDVCEKCVERNEVPVQNFHDKTHLRYRLSEPPQFPGFPYPILVN
jgi:hypothetical protein